MVIARIHRTRSILKHIVVRMVRFIRVKRYKAISAKGKGHAVKTSGNQVQASKSLLPPSGNTKDTLNSSSSEF